MHRAIELKNLFESFLEMEKFLKDPQDLYDPINYIMNLGGKRFRPILVLMGYELFNDSLSEALPLALSVEMFHNFSLVHDDIMDEASLRRGQASVHMKFGSNTAILAGDLMLIYAFNYIIQANYKNKTEILKVFNQMCINVCEGQQLDMEFENKSDISISEYLGMIENKTSVLLGAALQMGAMAAEAGEEDAYHLYQYGKNLGIAFQIQDDVLDVFGDPDKFGKQWGGDIIQGKKTYLYIKANELLSDAQKSDFDKFYISNHLEPNEKIAHVKKVFEELNVLEYAKQTQEAYAQLSQSHLSSLSISDFKLQSLQEMSKSLFVRDI